MGGHVDNMERDYAYPVVSASLGCAAVFLIGGQSKDDAPVPVLLRSGDVVVLAGHSRLAFHGVARVVPDSAPQPLFGSAVAGAGADGALLVADSGAAEPAAGGAPGPPHEEACFRRFVAGARININVRQVESVAVSPPLES